MYVLNLSWQDFNPDIINVLKYHKSTAVNSTPVSKSFNGGKVVGKGVDFKASFPLQEDISIGLESQFQDAADLVPGIASKLQTLKSVMNAASGTSSEFFNLFKLQVWQETNPVQMTFKLVFHTKTDAWADVWVPAMSLASLSVLKKIGTGEGGIFRTPGVSLANFAKIKAAQLATKNVKDEAKGKKAEDALNKELENKDGFENGNMVGVHIPGLIRFEDGFVPKCNLTFSKESTKMGAPLWAEIELQVQTTLPAYDQILTSEGYKFVKDGNSQIGLGKELASFAKNLFI